MAPTLLVIVASTRPGRSGRGFGDWMVAFAQEHSAYNVQLADLGEINLPFFDEPQHPRLGQYTHAHTKAWAELVGQADAFVIVTPEYNYSFPAALKNALDFLGSEWSGKPVGFLSYGGGSGGVRAVSALLPVVTALGMVTTPAAIAVPFAQQYVGADGTVTIPDQISAAGITMLANLERLGAALQPEA